MKKYLFLLALFPVATMFAGEEIQNNAASSLLQQGGTTLLVLIAMSVFFAAMSFFLFMSLRGEILAPTTFMQEAEKVASGHDIEALTALCQKNDSPAAKIIGAAAEDLVLNPEASYNALRDSVEDEGARQAGALWQRIQYLMDIAVVAPMIGLLGTVLGMREAFTGMRVDLGSANPVHLADGVSKAMFTTAAGLILGIVAMCVYSYFRGRVHDLVSDLEHRCGRVLRIFVSKS
jgi:biopolymer transport protein ExbB